MNNSGTLRMIRQRGAALVVALLIAALVAVFASRVGYQYVLSVQRAGNVLQSDQAYFYLLSGEKLATAFLVSDPTIDFDSLEELQATALQFPIDGGVIEGYLVDAQSKFNINNVARAGPRTQGSPSGAGAGNASSTSDWDTAFASFLVSFSALGLGQFEARAIVNAMKDWVDDNDILQQGGSEADYYANLDVPYRPANSDFQHISELLLVQGMTPQIYNAIKPYITAIDGGTLVNINTALPEVIRSLGADSNQLLSETEIQAIIDDREDPSVDVNQRPGSAALNPAFPGIDSEYFEFIGSVKLGPISMPMRSLLKRQLASNGDFEVSVVYRSLNTL